MTPVGGRGTCAASAQNAPVPIHISICLWIIRDDLCGLFSLAYGTATGRLANQRGANDRSDWSNSERQSRRCRFRGPAPWLQTCMSGGNYLYKPFVSKRRKREVPNGRQPNRVH